MQTADNIPKMMMLTYIIKFFQKKNHNLHRVIIKLLYNFALDQKNLLKRH